jgi:hypothetical protein
LTLCAAPVAAVADHIGFVRHHGPGCPEGTVAHVYNPTTETLTLSFDRFQVALAPGQASEKTEAGEDRARSECTIELEMQAGRRMQMAWTRVQYLGFIDKRPGAAARVVRIYAYGDDRQLRKVRRWERDADTSDDFLIEDRFSGWSACAERVPLRIKTRLVLQGRPEAPSEVVMDRQHVQSSIVSQFRFRRCDEP